jgi:hypothetical protein
MASWTILVKQDNSQRLIEEVDTIKSRLGEVMIEKIPSRQRHDYMSAM